MTQPTKIGQPITDSPRKPTRFRSLLVPVIVSLAAAGAILPNAPFGRIQYARGYLFLFLVACALATVAAKTKTRRYWRASTILLWCAAVLPIAIVVIPGLLMRALGLSK